jgi:hypothetical protein
LVISKVAAFSWLFRTFGEDDRKITNKAQTPKPAASVPS